jgi:hypothetical protein
MGPDSNAEKEKEKEKEKHHVTTLQGTAYFYKDLGMPEMLDNIPIWLCNIPSNFHPPFGSIIQLFKGAW